MHLKSLTLKGFKSFASATTLKFEPGICAVVGPNGSGKSNIVDALAWVMGEQGAKTLRGSTMEDVIFAGAGERQALGRAEVTLTFDNSDGTLPIEFTEVSITRRMFRDGASEYEINGAKARLMDIQELLSDSGIGREMHVIVGQGRLSEILQSKPEDRRAFIEEAAGVLKHKRRKEKAQRKLVNMQANLDRLYDIIGELKRQLKPLSRQAEAAGKAQVLQAEVREARKVIETFQALDLAHQTKVAEAALAAATAELELANKLKAEADTNFSQIDEELSKLGVDLAQQLFFSLSTLKEKLAATERIARERAQSINPNVPFSGMNPADLLQRADLAKKKQEELDGAVATAREIREQVRATLENIEKEAQSAEAEYEAHVKAIAAQREGKVRLESLHTQRESLVAEIERAMSEARRLEEELGTAKAQAETLSESAVDDTQVKAEEQAAEERLKQLRGQERELERKVSALESRIEVLEEQKPKQSALETIPALASFSPLAESLQAEAGFERALEAALGDFTEALIGDLDSVLDSLQDPTGISHTVLLTKGDDKEPWHLDIELSQGTWLLDHLEAIHPAINRLLADIVVAENLEEARAIVEAEPRLRAVTKAGHLVGQGWLSLGQEQSSVQFAHDIRALQQELEANKVSLAEVQATVGGAVAAAQEARIATATAMAKKREEEQKKRGALEAVERATKAVERHNTQVAELRARERQLDIQIELATKKVDDSLIDTEANPETRDKLRATLEEARNKEVEARMNLRQAQDQANEHRGKEDHLRRQAKREEENLKRHQAEMAKRKARKATAETVLQYAETLTSRVTSALSRAQAQRDQLLARQTELKASAQNAKGEAARATERLGKATEAKHKAEIALNSAHVRVQEAQFGELEEEFKEIVEKPGFDVEEWKARLAKKEKSLASLGKVNPLALEEFKALQQRHDFLEEQIADVEKARADLRTVIKDVDKRILQLFTDAWYDVEKIFPEIFQTLFPGGAGRLVLTDPEDMLTTGIEVEARPPGKKVKRLSLLSGGEKSLTALAMLVAIFMARPSPFYVMDEVEAALDEANLRRLIRLFEQLRTNSQLLVITHQKLTMEVANVLYGITMRDGVSRTLTQRLRTPDNAPAGD
ncbi:MAG: chromosome segregation protein SMC [Corynebacterium sp.]|nr:chromosome segregation protein SMC [Corynebacterium sp.]